MTVIQFVNYARKFLVAVVAALAILGTALIDNSVSPSEWVTIAIAFFAAFGIYAVPNTPEKDL